MHSGPWLFLMFLVAVLGIGCTGGDAGESVGDRGERLCSGMTLTSSATGPVTDTVTFTTTGPTCDVGETPEYLFRYRSAVSSTWLDLQNWSASSTAVWQPAGLAPGRYLIRARARAAGQTARMTPWKEIAVLVGEACQVTSLETNLAPPQSIGTPVHLVATTTCSGGTPEYRFHMRSPSGQVTTLQDWGPSPTLRWETTGLLGGTYTLEVSTRRVGNPDYDSDAGLSFRIGETCDSPRLTPSPSSSVMAGTPVTLRGQASCSSFNFPAQFRFTYLASGASTPVVIQDWSASDIATWDTTGLPSNEYLLRLEVRASDGGTVTQSSKKLSFRIGNCVDLSASLSPTGTIPSGGSVDVRGTATCAPGVTPEYRFSYREKTGTDSIVFRDWSPDSQAVWNTQGVPTNNYYVVVDMRASDFAGGPLQSVNLAIAFGDICDSLLSYGVWSTVEGHIGLAASARCGSGSPEFRFSYEAPGSSARTLIRDWGSDTALLDTTGLPSGRYTFIVDVRAIGSGVDSQRTARRMADVGYLCRSSGFTAARNTPLGSEILVHSSSSCTRGRAEQDFFYRRAGEVAWTAIQTGASDRALWETAGLPVGEYELKVDVRPEGGPITDSKMIGYAVCEPGYDSRGGAVCSDIDECSLYTFGPTCDPLVTCTNLPGGHRCGPCPQGYTGDGDTGCVESLPGRRFREIEVMPGVTCGIREEDATIACWGRNDYGQATPPAGAFKKLSSSRYGFCGVREDGDVVCWPGAERVDLLTGQNFTDFARGGSHQMCGLRADGTLLCVERFDQPWLPRAGTYSAISASSNTLCGLHTDGTVTCWGSSPQFANANGRFASIAVNDRHVCGLRLDGQAECWGELFGLPPLAEFTMLSEGPGKSCGVHSDGVVSCWPDEPRWLPGSYVSVSSAIWTVLSPHLPAPDGWYGRSGHSCALRADGTVRCWGDDGSGEVTQPGVVPFDSLTTGDNQTCGIDAEGQIHCWGNNEPPLVAPPSGAFTQVSMGRYRNCALRSDQTVQCWDASQTYALDGLFKSVSVGVEVCGIALDDTLVCPDISSYPRTGTHRRVSVGPSHVCAIRSNGRLRCFGDNGVPQSIPPPTGIFLEVAVGDGFSCGIRQDRTLACWGSIEFAQTAPPSGQFGSLDVGANWACAVATNGAIACWGDACWKCPVNGPGSCACTSPDCSLCQPPPGSFKSVTVRKSATPYACGLRTDGTEVCWGRVAR